ncbi:MAG: sigma 54-interacting transcriptional regulator [Candidatus Riflebacteria bacterium]|nr:sigma 54-interacting transcriptional regulator [Candidatus Riflebacteria bacterium]
MDIIVKNKQHEPFLLLESNPEAVVSYSNGSFSVKQFPEWLAKFLGKNSEEIIGKSLESYLEPVIPGITELAEMVLKNGTNVTNYQSSVFDTKNNMVTLHINARLISFPSQNLISFSFSIGESSYFQNLPQIRPEEIPNFHGIVGNSLPMKKIFNKIKLYGATDAPVLITGETGTGKEGAAKALHLSSQRANEPFVAVNCSAITETLFESELFGHEKGSFTGAMKSHRGRFERANRGTLFLDEMGDLPLPLQAKLLRVIEEQQIERVGSEKSVPVDVRLIAATNRKLEDESRTGTFRADLFFRISALTINLPPLRERTDDIQFLVMHFIFMLNKKYGRNVISLRPEALHILKQYTWPGNIRELRNLMERLFAENQTDVFGLRSLKEWYEERIEAGKHLNGTMKDDFISKHEPRVLGMDSPRTTPQKLPLNPENIKTAYHQASGNMTKTAEILGIHKATLYRNLKLLNLTRETLGR